MLAYLQLKRFLLVVCDRQVVRRILIKKITASTAEAIAEEQCGLQSGRRCAD